MLAALRNPRLGVALHWATALFAVATAVASDPAAQRVVGGVFAVAGLAFAARAAIAGPMTRVGPRLEGSAKWMHLALHRGLLAVVVAVILTGLATGMAGPAIAESLGQNSPAMQAWHSRLYAALFALAFGHVIFNVWRGTALGDRPFARMLPKI